MSKGKTRSKLSLSERRERAVELIGRGFTDTDVARDLQVSRKTAATYRAIFEADLQERVRSAPDTLRDVLGNTFRQLSELDDIRKLTWQKLQRKKATIEVMCDGCGEITEYTYQEPPSDQATVQYQNVLLKAADSRSKLLGLLGVKQDVFIEIQNVTIVQTKIMAWLQNHLDPQQREKLAVFIETELAEYIGADPSESTTPVLPHSVLSDVVGSASMPIEVAGVSEHV